MSKTNPLPRSATPYLAELISTLELQLSRARTSREAQETRGFVIGALIDAISPEFEASVRAVCESNWSACGSTQGFYRATACINSSVDQLRALFQQKLFAGEFARVSAENRLRLKHALDAKLYGFAKVLLRYHKTRLNVVAEIAQTVPEKSPASGRANPALLGQLGLGRDRVQEELTRVINLKVEKVLGAMDLPARIARSFGEYAADISPLEEFAAEHAQAELRAAAADYAHRMANPLAPNQDTSLEFDWIIRTLGCGAARAGQVQFFQGTKEFAISRHDAAFSESRQTLADLPLNASMGSYNNVSSTQDLGQEGVPIPLKLLQSHIVRTGNGDLVLTTELYARVPAEGVV